MLCYHDIGFRIILKLRNDIFEHIGLIPVFEDVIDIQIDKIANFTLDAGIISIVKIFQCPDGVSIFSGMYFDVLPAIVNIANLVS